jgi:O-antigen/teichoic acid export membrane protein
MIKETGRILAADLIVAVTAFATLFFAPFVLSTAEFARMSLIIAVGMVLIIVLDFGLGQTALKRYAEAGDERWLSAMAALKIAIFLICLPIAAAAALAPGGDFFALALLIGAGMSLWGGLRIYESARQRFDAYLGANLKLAAFRLVLVPPALLVGGPALIVISLFAAPIALLAFLKVRATPEMLRLPSKQRRASLLSYAPAVYGSNVAYSALPYLPQFFMHARFGAEAIASYGIVMTFVGPFSMLLIALRTYLTPRILKQNDTQFASPFSAGGLKLMIAVTALGLAAVAVLTGCIYLAYAAKYPLAPWLFAAFASFFVLTSMVGLFNIRLHAHSLPHIEMIVNFARIAAAGAVLFWFGQSPFLVALLTGVVLLIGEIILLVWVEHAVRDRGPVNPRLETVSK